MKQLYTLALVAILVFPLAAQQHACTVPVDNRTFALAYADIAAQTMGKDRLIRDFTTNNCILSSQAKQLADLYFYDNDRLTYAYFAYTKVFDPENFEVVANAFNNNDDKARLRDFIRLNPLYSQPPYTITPPPPAPPVTNGPTRQPPIYPNEPIYQQQPVCTLPPPPPPPPVYVPGYTGRVGCDRPMSPNDFPNALQTVKSKSFESTKLQVAQQIIKANCLLADQVRQMVDAFDFESTKVQFAKEAYRHTYDIDNYLNVTSAFDFESSTKDLIAYMNSNTPANLPYANTVVPVNPNGAVTTTTTYTDPYGNTYQSTTYGNGNNPYNTPPPPPVYVPGYNGPIGCPMPMSANDFANAKRTIAAKSFDNTKLDMAKQIVNSNCITSAQVKELMGLFSFDNNRLEFAKAAYAHTYDKGNYYMVSDGFDFESNGKALMQYIR